MQAESNHTHVWIYLCHAILQQLKKMELGVKIILE